MNKILLKKWNNGYVSTLSVDQIYQIFSWICWLRKYKLYFISDYLLERLNKLKYYGNEFTVNFSKNGGILDGFIYKKVAKSLDDINYIYCKI